MTHPNRGALQGSRGNCQNRRKVRISWINQINQLGRAAENPEVHGKTIFLRNLHATPAPDMANFLLISCHIFTLSTTINAHSDKILTLPFYFML